jgi:hypothetical protein
VSAFSGEVNAEVCYAEKQYPSRFGTTARTIYITVIGYSFPETDTFMTRLLAEGLKSNNGLESINIVDSQSPNKWQDRLDRIFTSTLRTSKLEFISLDAGLYASLSNATDQFYKPDRF